MGDLLYFLYICVHLLYFSVNCVLCVSFSTLIFIKVLKDTQSTQSWLGLLTCKTVSRITYTVLVETLNTAQSIKAGQIIWYTPQVFAVSLLAIIAINHSFHHFTNLVTHGLYFISCVPGTSLCC